MDNLIDHYSYSSLSLYLRCPRQWKHKYIDKIPQKPSGNMQLGKVMHKAIQSALIEGANMEETIDSYLEGFNAEEGEAMVMTGDQLAWSKKAILDQDLNEWIQFEGAEGTGEVEIRMDFTMPGLPLPLVGYIDYISPDGTVWDFKTSGSSWNEEKAVKETQPAFYAAALVQSGFELPIKFNYLVLVKNKTPKIQIFELELTEKDLTRAYRMAADAHRGISAELFYANPSGWWCSSKTCDFWNICEAGRIS